MESVLLFRVLKPPATADEIVALTATCGALPVAYLHFLAQSNGAEWCINDQVGDCLGLWSTQEIAELNTDYAIPHYLPAFLAIGSDGGDDAIGIDRAESLDPERWPVVRIGFGNLVREDFLRLAPDFRDWWAGGFLLRTSSG